MRPIPLLSAIVLTSATAPAQTVVFSEDFESGYARWSMTDLWNAQEASEPCTTVAVPFPSGTHCVWYGSPTTCTFDPGNWDFQYLTCLEPIALPASAGTIELRFRSWSEGEDDGVWDTRKPQVSNDGGASWTTLPTVLSSDRWLEERFDLSRYAGQSVRLRFQFWTGDWAYNDFLGWLIDDVQVVEHAGPAVEHCFGDGTWYACPCGNQGGPGRGCATSFQPAGARLSASGNASLAADTLIVSADGLSEAVATIFQASTFTHGSTLWPSSSVGGDGLACLAGNFVRIRSLQAVGGAISHPAPGDTPISVQGAIPAAWTTRYYSVRYRNAASFCTPATFNLTNGLQITWRP